MLTEQIFEYEVRGPGLRGRTYTSTAGYFHTKTKTLRNIFEWIILLFTSKILQEAM